jgi:hypothetical protein
MSVNSGFSLVKYDTPILVSKSFGKNKQAGGSATIASQKTSASSNRSKDDPNIGRTEDYLNSILPPREY